MGAAFGGMIFSLATGWVVDHFSYVPVFVGFGILPLLAAGIFWSMPDDKDALAEISCHGNPWPNDSCV